MGHLRDGRWIADLEQPTNAAGEFVRTRAKFRNWIRADGSTRYAVEPSRYHLYAAHACPWAHRALIARSLLGMQDAISLSIVHPLMLEDGWVFRDEEGLVPDPIFGAQALWEIYVKADPKCTGKATVPVLFDRKTGTIVSNQSREILRMFTTELAALHTNDRELCPEHLRTRIDETISAIYRPINNGVYRAGFAANQEAHERAVRELFLALDHWEHVLAHQRFTCGDTLTEADICLFTTLFRFDLVYATHFKCNIRRLAEYPNLFGFVRDVYQTPGVAQTCDPARIKLHYFGSHRFLNPRGIVPLGFHIDYDAPHERARIGRARLTGS